MLNFKLTDTKRPLVSETRRKTAREVVLDGITHQIGLLSDANYKVERTRYVKNGDGGPSRKSVSAPPKPWWWQAGDGTMLTQIKYGHGTAVEIEPGKPTIIAGKSSKDVIKVLEQVREAVVAGHLDIQIEAAQAKAKLRRNKSE